MLSLEIRHRESRGAASRFARAEAAAPETPETGVNRTGVNPGGTQWKLSPQAQLFCAFGLSMVKPCFSMVSTKSMDAPCT